MIFFLLLYCGIAIAIISVYSYKFIKKVIVLLELFLPHFYYLEYKHF